MYEQEKSETTDSRLGMRLSSELKTKIDYAAQLKGVPTAGFVKTILAEAADRTIREYQQIELTRKDREAFVRACLNPPAPTKKALEAARRYKKRLGL